MEALNYLLTGRPGAGKTTLLLKIAAGLSGLRIGGFFTREIRENGSRVGFRIETFSGESGILAHTAGKSRPCVGKYRVDVPTFERIGVDGLENALAEADVIFIDEIGKMELFSRRFREVLVRVLDSAKTVVATVMAYRDPFSDALKARPDIRLMEVSPTNRDLLAGELVKQIIAIFRG